MWIILMLEPDVSQRNYSQKGNGSNPSISEFLIEHSRKSQHPTGNCVERFQPYRLLNIAALDFLFHITCIVTINPSSTYRDASDSYPTVSFDIKFY